MPILIAEDEPLTRLALSRALSGWGYHVTAVEDGPSALSALSAAGAPQLAILDWEMPGLSGLEVCREIRALEGRPYIYVILVTGRDRPADLLDGHGSGVDDYLTKPYDDQMLELRVRAGRRIVDLQRQLISAKEAAQFQADHDALTGLWNRGRIVSFLSSLCDRRQTERIGIVLFDLDHFKRFNDEHGHAAGDAILREVAGRVSNVLRPYDGFGRYGGEEFLLVLPDCDAETAVKVAERARIALGESSVEIPGGKATVTASFGVVSFEGKGVPVDFDGLLTTADTALYRSKAEGRNRVTMIQ